MALVRDKQFHSDILSKCASLKLPPCVTRRQWRSAAVLINFTLIFAGTREKYFVIPQFSVDALTPFPIFSIFLIFGTSSNTN